MGILDSIFDFAASPKGLVSILAALASAKDRERARPATGGGVSYAMPGPRRLQAVKNLGRYTDVMGLANGGTADADEAVKALLYGIAQGPYGPLLAYDIPELNLAPVAPKPEKPRVTQPTAATINESSYEIPPPAEGQPVGTYNRQINDFLTGMVARGSYGPTGLAGRGLGAFGQYLVGSIANALGREKTPEELASMPSDESRQGTPAAYAGYGLTPEEMNAISSGGSYAEMADPYSGSGGGGDGWGGSDPMSDSASVDGPAGSFGFAQGGPVRMEDGGFVLTERAVK